MMVMIFNAILYIYVRIYLLIYLFIYLVKLLVFQTISQANNPEYKKNNSKYKIKWFLPINKTLGWQRIYLSIRINLGR